MQTLDVAAAWRRQGLARRLMTEVEERMAAAGVREMKLHVFRGNVAAVRLYESLGYGRVGRVEGYYGRGLDAVVYGKRL